MLGYINNRVGDSVLVKFNFSVICSLCLTFFIKACLLFLQIFWIYSNGQQNKTHYSNRAKCEKDCYFFFLFLLGLNLFTFVRVAEKMYTSPGKRA